uniref:Uncharacterized protein n=1 Tax=Micrurus spixii TaxID=129469 RepID=A0A2D4N537_9SAUR
MTSNGDQSDYKTCIRVDGPAALSQLCYATEIGGTTMKKSMLRTGTALVSSFGVVQSQNAAGLSVNVVHLYLIRTLAQSSIYLLRCIGRKIRACYKMLQC